MKATVAVLGILATRKDGLILVELALFDRDVNFDDVLPDYATGTNVQVSREDTSAHSNSMRIVSRTRLPSCP